MRRSADGGDYYCLFFFSPLNGIFFFFLSPEKKREKKSIEWNSGASNRQEAVTGKNTVLGIDNITVYHSTLFPSVKRTSTS